MVVILEALLVQSRPCFMVLFSCCFCRIGCATPPCWSCWAHCSSADGLVCVVGLFPVAGVVALSGAALLNVVCYALYSWLLEFMLAFASLVATICRHWLAGLLRTGCLAVLVCSYECLIHLFDSIAPTLFVLHGCSCWSLTTLVSLNTGSEGACSPAPAFGL
ncbi:hypothetical protein NC652_034009 [Populus alba x Populus x berolinensis]|uniref:Uncharacterized protein n=1 Tax=Populus alba x Populus x berolinensis TaxID=444605 RepID=A0AAD6PZN3_9ROSI|nr:hypothetical protein NC652_034009 [Populus alba x Populus x berolinensis]KAJ6973719.1 hypothetical protein NC653_033915 [Populus alba x Populus x berolinensis]